ncbi:Ig-like domain-containing protein [Epilithonimonas xixisoli]|uniref:Ig-like domain-containing protein n=1 Tax=Epilithonimonas xixisoli TaxID=1476462 RepID=A0A4R8I8V5_9FLAO|nr:Ig-like domain-containing protein [Epilithonimonas xixisoli]TDX84915.1 Ig-like domain-containing protein [Epilithonimonas xixisoli]
MKQFLLWLFASLVLVSCARVGSPVGGDKDSIPPSMVGSNIDTTRINVPRDIKKLRIDFDEYITLKDVSKNLIISPPIQYSKIIPSSTGNKYLEIQWKDTLQANTTYNFNFGNSIVDLNESNILPYFNFAFSTGEKLDDLYISGTLSDALGNEKNSEGKDKNLVVGLYQVKDTMNYRQKPYYIAKADLDGYFELNYLTPGKYKIIGFDDENNNSIYDIGKENVAFQKDEIDLQTSISGLKLKTFPSKKMAKYKEMTASVGGITMVFEGNPEKVIVKTVGEKPADYKVTHKSRSDSVKIWFDATKENIGATVSENLRFSYDTGAVQDTMSVFYKKPTKDEMTVTNPFGNKLVPETDFRFSSNYIINKIQPENWKLEADSIAQNFTARISELDSTQVFIKSDFVVGKKYQLTVPKNTLSSFYTRSSESVRFDFEVSKAEDFGSFSAHLKNIPSQKFWIQLLNEKNEPAYQQYTNQTDIKFINLKPGSYRLRILVDNNENGVWDSADFANEVSAEDVYIFKKMGDKEVMSKINVRQMWEINENWDLTLEEQPVN